MATAARKVSVVISDSSTAGLAKNTDFKVVYGNATANDITQLSTSTVLLIVDADSTTGTDRTKLVAMAESAVKEMKRQLFLVDTPAHTSTSTATSYRPRGA